MKPIDKKDAPKLFALIGVAVIAFGYGIFTLASGSGAKAPAPAASPDPKAVALAKTLSDAADNGTWHPDALPVSLPTGARDPFMPQGDTAPKATPSPAPLATPPPPDKPAPPIRPTENPAWPVQPLKIIGPGHAALKVAPVASPTPVPAPPPTLAISGVLVSDESARSVAIVKGDKGSRFLNIGDAAGNGWRVTNIKQREIEITDPKTGRRETVEMKL